MKKRNLKNESDKIFTVPTFLNILRIILSFVIIYMILAKNNVIIIVIVFSIAAISDWFDGAIARRYNLVNEFGRKLDVIADRILWAGTAIAFLYSYSGYILRTSHLIQLILIMIREIIATPFAIIALFYGKIFPHVRYVGKITTVAQGFALPAVMLSVFYPSWSYFSFPASIITGLIGIISGIAYIKDIRTSQKI